MRSTVTHGVPAVETLRRIKEGRKQGLSHTDQALSASWDQRDRRDDQRECASLREKRGKEISE